jgi:hypothetical protein
MKGSQQIERTFALRQYENLKIQVSISEVPQELLLNKVFMNHLTYLMLVDIESVALRYNALTNTVNSLVDKDKVKFIEEQKQETINTIVELFHIFVLEQESDKSENQE